MPFNDVLTVNHDSGQKAWFKQQQRSVFMIANTNYFTTGSTFGLWTSYGVVAGYPYAFQMGMCWFVIAEAWLITA